MQQILLMDCGDGYTRADNGGLKGPVAKTAAYTVLPEEAGTLFTNQGAGGAVTFTLPAAKAGLWFGFLRHAAQNVTVTATGGAKINGGSGNGSIVLHGGTTPGALRYVEIFSNGTDWYTKSTGPGTKIFVSTEQTGDGNAQNIAHTLGVAPLAVFVAPTDTAPATTGAYTVTEGVHDATNVIVTVTASKKYKVMAIA